VNLAGDAVDWATPATTGKGTATVINTAFPATFDRLLYK
jgi:hypothetical protein